MLNLSDLNRVRELMIEEFNLDMSNQALYRSERLTDSGWALYPAILAEAILSHDDNWLEAQIRSRGLLKHTEQKRKPKGGFTTASVPRTAAMTLAEGEFNRFYIRAVCRYTLSQGGDLVEVYRAKVVSEPRLRSQQLLGTRVEAKQLLESLRRSSSMDAESGIPGGPNSGLSVRMLD